MLIRKHILDRIADGTVSLAFRRWRRPTVKVGGRLNTAIGVLAIDAVATVDADSITREDARNAGHETLADLLEALASRSEGTIYRIALRYIGADPRIAMRADDRLTATELGDIAATLKRLDGASPWTLAVLDLIADHPGRRAPDLAVSLGFEVVPLKVKVRKLKALGLTESLDIGYRLSPRGVAVRVYLRA